MDILEVNEYLNAASDALQDDPEYFHWIQALGNARKQALDECDCYTDKVEGCLWQVYARQVKYILENKDNWGNKIWGINGDETYKTFDENRKATLTIELFKNKDGKCYNALGSISDQGHECREHTCENAWRFMSNFRRLENGTIEGGDFDTVRDSFTK